MPPSISHCACLLLKTHPVPRHELPFPRFSRNGAPIILARAHSHTTRPLSNATALNHVESPDLFTQTFNALCHQTTRANIACASTSTPSTAFIGPRIVSTRKRHRNRARAIPPQLTPYLSRCFSKSYQARPPRFYDYLNRYAARPTL